jgi:hypothetical protein
VTKRLGKIIHPILGKNSPKSDKPRNVQISASKLNLKVQNTTDNNSISIGETDRQRDCF